MKAVVAAFNQEKALVGVGAFSVITNLWMDLRFKLKRGASSWCLFWAEMETLGCGDNEANDGSVTLSTVSTRSNIQHYLSSSRHKVRGLGDADIDLIV